MFPLDACYRIQPATLTSGSILRSDTLKDALAHNKQLQHEYPGSYLNPISQLAAKSPLVVIEQTSTEAAAIATEHNGFYLGSIHYTSLSRSHDSADEQFLARDILCKGDALSRHCFLQAAGEFRARPQ
jgi:hypothetical protein